MTTIPSISPLPTPVPTTEDPDDFDARGDAFLSALPDMVDEQNASIGATNIVAGEVASNAAATAANAAAAATSAAAAVGALSYVATSSSSFSAAPGSKAFLLNETGRAFAPGGGQAVAAVRKGDLNMRLYGVTTSYASNTLTVNVTSVTAPGGPFTDWIIFDGVFETTPPAQSTALAIAFAVAL